MKLIIRNTSRDKTTAALRRARPGDVQPNPVIKKIRLPPGGSISVDSKDLNTDEVALLVTLVGAGCLKVFSSPPTGPMRQISVSEIQEFAPAAAPAPEPAPAPAPEPEPEPISEPEPEPEPVVDEVEETPAEEPVQETPAYLEGELKVMKNAELRGILLDMGFDQSSGMRKSDLVAKILEIQEA